MCKTCLQPAFQSVFSVKKRNYLKVSICKNSCEDTLLQCYKILLCYLSRIQADDIDCVILATTSVLYYKYLTRMVLTKEKETGSEDENICYGQLRSLPYFHKSCNQCGLLNDNFCINAYAANYGSQSFRFQSFHTYAQFYSRQHCTF